MDAACNVVVVGAGTIGRRIVDEALDRGHFVRVIVRDLENATEDRARLSFVQCDVLDPLIRQHLEGQDVVISAVGTARAEKPDASIYLRAAESLVDALRTLVPAAPRLIAVGGVGSLLDRSGAMLLDRVPEERRAEHLGQKAALDFYRTVSDVEWTYLSPPGRLAAGERTGTYRTGGETLLLDAEDESAISMEDYAVALVDEVEEPRHVGRRFTIAYERLPDRRAHEARPKPTQLSEVVNGARPVSLIDVATFALVHGGGGSAWDWHLVAPALRERGHDPVAADLPSEDESAGWSEYASSIVAAVGDRRDVVVVGHSLGGFTAPLVCARIRVEVLVLVAAMIPAPGELFTDWWKHTGYEESSSEDVFYHDVPAALAAEARRRERNEASKALREPWPLATWPDTPSRYLLCRDDRMFPAAWARRHARERLGLDADEMDGGHYVPLSRPQELAERLHGYATARS